MSDPKKNSELAKKIIQANKVISVGAKYSHFKNPRRHYIIIALGIQEATNEVCVLYQALYGDKLIFVRNLTSWLETVEVHGSKTPRFIKVSAPDTIDE